MSDTRVGVDVGGTFTDLVCIDTNGSAILTKTLTTHPDQADGVATALGAVVSELGSLNRVECVVHGTTVATNTLLERSGARTVLWTTEGFRDVLHIGRHARGRLYDLTPPDPSPLVARNYRREVRERISSTGEVLTPFTEVDIAPELDFLSEQGVEAVAVCLLNSYVNDRHERLLAQVLERRAPACFVALSADISPEIREFERMNATVVSAYVGPGLRGYLSRIEGVTSGGERTLPLMVLQSGGGMVPAGMAVRRGVNTLLSGPAGGVLGAAAFCRSLGVPDAITADVGGTSFDIGLITDGSPVECLEGEVAGFPLRFPRLDVHTIGTGGGSIAWVDSGGALRVGPRSAGSRPGPASFMNGGTEPTLTDANVALGFLTESLRGVERGLDATAANKAIERVVAARLGLSVTAAAEGIVRVANASMAAAIRLVTVERGIDPAGYSLLAYGGAGPLHACEVARLIGARTVLVPSFPGNFSALGAAIAPLRIDAKRTVFISSEETGFLEDLVASLGQVQQNAIGQARLHGLAQDGGRCLTQIAVRYAGEAYELLVPVVPGLTAQQWAPTRRAFDDLHERLYGFARREDPVRIVNVHCSYVVDRAAGWPDRFKWQGPGGDEQKTALRKVWLGDDWHQMPVVPRLCLKPGDELEGPAIVTEPGATTYIPPGARGHPGRHGVLEIEVGRRA